jgi:Fur family transcriptional regulator, ferric uptake regulator
MKASIRAKATEMLKASRLYRTEARVAILAVLLKASRPITQEQIADELDPRHDKVTIYRTLASLLQAGLVHKALTGAKTWQFELGHRCTQHQCHPHFTCTHCGSTHCLPDLEPPLTRGPYRGFVIQRQQVLFEGLCPGCAGL